MALSSLALVRAVGNNERDGPAIPCSGSPGPFAGVRCSLATDAIIGEEYLRLACDVLWHPGWPLLPLDVEHQVAFGRRRLVVVAPGPFRMSGLGHSGTARDLRVGDPAVANGHARNVGQTQTNHEGPSGCGTLLCRDSSADRVHRSPKRNTGVRPHSRRNRITTCRPERFPDHIRTCEKGRIDWASQGQPSGT